MAVLATLCLSGCCTHYVSNIGKSEARLKQKRVLSNSEGDLVVEADLTRNPFNNRESVRSLGLRYVYLVGPDARQEIADVVRRGQVQTRKGTNHVQISKGNFNPEYVGRWRFEPADVLNRVESTPLPSHIAQPLQEYAGRRWDGKDWTESHLRYNLDGTNYAVEVCVSASGIWFPEAYHQAKWGYPLRILYLPAFAVDVVTSPIQFIWLVNQFSKWGDGSGVR